jgi:predicted transcriptional regulator
MAAAGTLSNVRETPAQSIAAIYAALAATAGPGAPEMAEGDHRTYEPAVTSRKSLASDEHIISMIDGKPYKTLRRHLAGHGLTPETYRERYGLRPDYPMVAKAYSESRRAMAKKIGLGRKPASNS